MGEKIMAKFASFRHAYQVPNDGMDCLWIPNVNQASPILPTLVCT
jgi:hypothetical protein